MKERKERNVVEEIELRNEEEVNKKIIENGKEEWNELLGGMEKEWEREKEIEGLGEILRGKKKNGGMEVMKEGVGFEGILRGKLGKDSLSDGKGINVGEKKDGMEIEVEKIDDKEKEGEKDKGLKMIEKEGFKILLEEFRSLMKIVEKLGIMVKF